MKILQLYFILLSKLYVRFSKRKNDWYYMPVMILSSLFGLNTFVLTSIFLKVNPYYFIVAIIFCFFTLSFYFGRFAKNKEFVENFKLSKQTKQITSKIKKLNKVLPELKYFTEFHIENCDKNNNILLYLKNKYPSENVYIGYIKWLYNDVVLYIYSRTDFRIYEIINKNIDIKK